MTYRSWVEQGEVPVIRGYQRTGKDKLRKDHIEELMYYLNCDSDKIIATYGLEIDYFSEEILNLKPFIDAQIISLEDQRINLTCPYPMANKAIAHLVDQPMPKSQISSSQASYIG